jgi:hypothetical protein
MGEGHSVVGTVQSNHGYHLHRAELLKHRIVLCLVRIARGLRVTVRRRDQCGCGCGCW